MKNISRILMIVFISAITLNQSFAVEEQLVGKQSTGLKETAAGCAPASGFEWLDINNVRARINTGGDMWWDLPGGTGSKYYIPKNGSATAMFSGALWIGGLDINNQLKLAAQRYRQVGIDYWTGPLTIDGTAAIDEIVCAQYDKHFRMNRQLVDDFIGQLDENGFFKPSEDYEIPAEIMQWPAHGDPNKGQSYYLAPFYDRGSDGVYDPNDGDYPYYDISNELCHKDIPTMDEEFEGTIYGSILADQVIKGDQTLWWVFNDKGNVHTETSGSAIGMEVRAQAFAFATNDVINNMTFYSYEIINRSTFELTQTYFSPWVDTDLGYAWDDFVGCDVQRGLGYCYNGSAVDGSGDVEAYGGPEPPPPAVGVDFFQGPYMDDDQLDNPKYEYFTNPETGFPDSTQLCDESINGVNFGNGIVDDERFGMRRFVYHNNGGNPAQSDPQIAPEYYNFLKGIWKDNTKMMYGGTAHASGAGTVGPECDFMFPGDSDPCNWGTGQQPPNGGYNQNGFYWTEETGDDGAPNPSGDRRFMQSAGPFTLKPGAVNYITVGIPWARATAGGPFASVELLRVVDDKCQALFDNCFKVIDGPSAPDLAFRELDQRVIVYISNSPSSNNYREKYKEYDNTIIQPNPASLEGDSSDPWYRFEGYQIFQLKDPTVSIESVHDPDQMRLVAQFDVKNGVGKLVNYYYDEFIGGNVPVVEVVGGDNGIQHSFELTQDAFATGEVSLINNKQYYYTALAYAYNEYLPYSDGPVSYLGQKEPYLSGRRNIKTYVAMPHKTVNGTVINGEYGTTPQITRLNGNGNGGLVLELTDETVDEIMSKPPAGPDNLFGDPDYPIAYNPVYKENAGPLNIQIIDPLNVVGAEYVLWMDTLTHHLLHDVTGRPELEGDTTSKMVANWTIRNMETGEEIKGDTTIVTESERLFLDLGISVNITQPFNPGPIPVGRVDVDGTLKTSHSILAPNNGLLESSIEYADSSSRWLSGVEDNDVPGDPFNWIRSGNRRDDADPANNDWYMSASPPNPWDDEEVYERLLNGTWAPAGLTSAANNYKPGNNENNQIGPMFSVDAKVYNTMEKLASVDIVMTPDKSKWTRCPVIEMSYDQELAEGNAFMHGLRASPSVDKDGNFATLGSGPSDNPEDPNYISEHGMGWFPGYAINIETGERMNMMFSEDSYLVGFNGRDMLFNPTARNLSIEDQEDDPNVLSGVGFPLLKQPVFGGKHFVYVLGHNTTKEVLQGVEFKYEFPAYDAGRTMHTMLDTVFDAFFDFSTHYVYSNIMYIGMPMAVEGQDWLSNEAKIRFRVSKPFKPHYAELPLDTVYPGMDVNGNQPMYAFSTEGLATQHEVVEKIETDLDRIRVVPNPYYAYSAYENNALDNRVRITNIPKSCIITIFDVSGIKVRQFSYDVNTVSEVQYNNSYEKEDYAQETTSIEWDLKNFAGVPISGGIYYIHIKSPQGERVIKWFGMLRVPDLNTF